MLELIALVIIGVFIVRRVHVISVDAEGHGTKTVVKLEKLWQLAQKSMKDKKYIPAEKALLTILKLDHKNAPAYNRLGILYAKQKNFEDAVECFEIASSINKKPSSLHNLGLIYYETGQFEKATTSFEKAIEIEPMAVRYIALAKAYHKLEDYDQMIMALEKTVELEKNPQTLSLLHEGYKQAGREADAARVKAALSRSQKSNPDKKIKNQPRAVR